MNERAMANSFPSLVLPKRFEALERVARDNSADLSKLVYKVEPAARRIEQLIKQIQNGGLGRFESFLGKSGSGKTTFFSTLPQFFAGVNILSIPSKVALSSVARYVRQRHISHAASPTVWVLYDRDNPTFDANEVGRFFESLRVLFREDEGRILLAWPITDATVAAELGEIAWKVGRDSVLDVNTKGVYKFEGVPKNLFHEIADVTTTSLLPGYNLEAFGLTKAITNRLAGDSDTIAEFYSRLEAKSEEINGSFGEVLKERVTPKIWILVAGDDSREINLTVSTLTQGREKRVDVDRVLSFLDDKTIDAAYLKEWRARRSNAAYLLRRFDVRIFELPPNVALAAVRIFGDKVAKAPLRNKTTARKPGLEAISNASFMRVLLGDGGSTSSVLRATDEQTAADFRRMQNIASVNDQRFSKAIAQAISTILEAAGKKVNVSSEQAVQGGNLIPDIKADVDGSEIYCLEITWRTTGAGIQDEIERRQNTLTVGHIQKYMLEKVIEYVKDFDL